MAYKQHERRTPAVGITDGWPALAAWRAPDPTQLAVLSPDLAAYLSRADANASVPTIAEEAEQAVREAGAHPDWWEHRST